MNLLTLLVLIGAITGSVSNLLIKTIRLESKRITPLTTVSHPKFVLIIVCTGTPVHWAILNGHVETLRVLLELGCDPNPVKARHQKRSSIALESPLELCERLYGTSSEIGLEISKLLQNYTSTKN